MNSEQVRAYVNAKWPQAMQSPVALAIASGLAATEALVALELQRIEAYRHARNCIDACQSHGIEFDEETVSHNVECNCPDLSIEECDAIAHRAVLFS